MRDWERVRLGLLLVLLLLVLLGGGASRADVLSLLYLRPAAVLIGTLILLTPGGTSVGRARAPLYLLAALASVIAIQLIPLPPALWAALPGHERFAALATLAGIDPPWRPISLSPDLTLNSLISLCIPAAILVGSATVDPSRKILILSCIVLGALASAVLGIVQVSGGGALYLYSITNPGMPVGFFSNRNHQATLLACALPLLAAWSVAGNREGNRSRRWAVVIVATFLIPMIIMTGSRAGVVVGAMGLLAALLIVRFGQAADDRPAQARRGRWLEFAPWVGGIVLVLVSLALVRAPAIERLINDGVGADTRVQALDVLWQMTRDFFPFGTGFGSFDPVYRIYEPYQDLGFQYLNHAHNDLLELILTGGLPAGLLLLAFLYWWVTRSVALLRSGRRGGGAALQLAASSVIAILLVASLFDYPLRTPITMAVFAIACFWLADPAGRAGAPPRREGAS